MDEKPLHWTASAKKDLLSFPDRVVDSIGYALGVVQEGGLPPSAQPWKGIGPGVRTARTDIALVRRRLQWAKKHYEERYGKQEKQNR